MTLVIFNDLVVRIFSDDSLISATVELKLDKHVHDACGKFTPVPFDCNIVYLGLAFFIFFTWLFRLRAIA